MSSSEQVKHTESQSAANRVKDLKAKLLSRQQTHDIRQADSTSSTPKSDIVNVPVSKDVVRINPASKPANGDAAATTRPLSVDDIVNASVQSKLDLSEDRALGGLVKSVMLYTSDGSICLDTVQKAFEAYSAKELNTWIYLEQAVANALDSVGSARDLLNASNEDLKSLFPDLQKFVKQASLTKRRRFEYNEKSTEILKVNSKEEAGHKFRDLSAGLDALRESNHKLARTIEYRRQQLEPLVYWTKVLETGRF
jgi:hypothetical protein